MPDANVTVTVKTQALPLYRVTEITVNSADMGSVFPSAEAKNGWYEGESVQIAVQPKSGCRIARAPNFFVRGANFYFFLFLSLNLGLSIASA